MKIKTIIIFLLLSTNLISQDKIELNNPSFEGISRCCTAPQNWEACGNRDLNTPDIQPGHFGVTNEPSSGETYLGMVTKDNETWESVSQRLFNQVQSGKKYSFSIFLAHSTTLISQSRVTDKDVYYDKPIKLRIWGGNKYCSKIELLGESSLINHEDWRKYEFQFEPTKNHTFILFEAFYKTPTLMPYNGNILLDDCSGILELVEEIDFEEN